MRIRTAGQAGFLFAAMVGLSACGDSGTTASDDSSAGSVAPPSNESVLIPQTGNSPNTGESTTPNGTNTGSETNNIQPPASNDDATGGNGSNQPANGGGNSGTNPNTTENTSDNTNTESSNSETNNASNNGDGDGNGSNSGDAANAAPVNQQPVQGTVPELVRQAVASGATVSGGNDDSPTETESLSLVGPFLKDTSRSAGPPSVPTGLVALMKSNNWVEFSWVPSVDDQSVEGYEVLRDGVPVYTVRGDTGYEFDYRSWLSTSYIDCNYTRYTICKGNQPADGATHQYSIVAIDNEGMRSAPSAPISITLAQAQQTSVDLSGFNLVLDEEFDGDSLDRNVWKTALAWGPDKIINAEMQYFVNLFDNDDVNYDPFKFTGSTLQITGIKTPASELGKANNQPYLSGVLNSQDNFSFTYGYVEMNAKIASGAGLLSTFYLFNQSFEDNQPEIDILEYIGDRPTKAYQTYHYYSSNRSRYGTGERHSTPTMETDIGFDLSSGFHKYGVLWEPELIVWYIDGVEVRRIEGPRVSNEPMNIVTQLVLGSEWIGTPNDSNLPAVLEIDYIKAWQRPQ